MEDHAHYVDMQHGTEIRHEIAVKESRRLEEDQKRTRRSSPSKAVVSVDLKDALSFEKCPSLEIEVGTSRDEVESSKAPESFDSSESSYASYTDDGANIDAPRQTLRSATKSPHDTDADDYSDGTFEADRSIRDTFSVSLTCRTESKRTTF